MKRYRGYSLLELMLVVMVIAILTAIAVPSHQNLNQNTTTLLVRTQLLHAIELTRQEALQRHAVMTLCGSADQLTCSDQWEKNLLLLNSDKAAVVFSFPFPKLSGTLHWRSFPRHRGDLTFLQNGMSQDENGTFWYCTPTAYPAFAIAISQSGRARTILPDNQGNLIDEKGQVIECPTFSR